MSSNLAPHDFKALYVKLGLVDGSSGNLAPLHRVCPNAEKCWNPSDIPVLNDGTVDESDWTTISHPWVGERFQELKLLCLGINMNHWGGFTACHDLIIDAGEEMEGGAIKVRFGNAPQDYAGTLFFHRMGMYAALIAQAAGIYKIGLPTHKEVVDAFNFIAYTNHIKCSPDNKEKGKPHWQMWEHCGNFILKKELAMLQPRVLLVLGISDNQHHLIEKVLDYDSVQTIVTLGAIEIKQASFDGQSIKLVVAPHPAAFGGSSLQLRADMQMALSTIKNW